MKNLRISNYANAEVVLAVKRFYGSHGNGVALFARSAPKRPIPPRRVPDPGEPLAYCADCREWTPMQWLPKAERWFRCEYCGGRKLTLRHMSMQEAMRRKAVTPAR